MTDLDAVAAVAHQPDGEPAGAVALTHGAGGSRESPLLIALCEEWARRGWLAVRYNLPYRRRRATGPPSGSPGADQAGVLQALAAVRGMTTGPLIAGGHSYGGRLTSMVAAEHPGAVAALTLFSYPLHPPGKPERLRTGHFAAITAPTVFTHGSADAFGGVGELRRAAQLIAAPTEIVEIAGAGHDLGFTKQASEVPTVPTLAVDAALRHSGLG